MTDDQKEIAKLKEQLRQMIAGKVADDQGHARAITLISERQVEELHALRQRCEEAGSAYAKLLVERGEWATRAGHAEQRCERLESALREIAARCPSEEPAGMSSDFHPGDAWSMGYDEALWSNGQTAKTALEWVSREANSEAVPLDVIAHYCDGPVTLSAEDEAALERSKPELFRKIEALASLPTPPASCSIAWECRCADGCKFADTCNNYGRCMAAQRDGRELETRIAKGLMS